ncbi:MarR family winged helix-turn-helix transcriptional regulator [Bombilactobacillus folatiphilus]|uniref:MarR family winged helix-turn-helix transcriptional regulator n=1 Tax=Bombilactobacillus folatiphilus TaxID=2923362 RepID=A0ABY4P8F5_9LACO|nr:MarR family winged helix-turn-helix transcriptional regulator [Bombilactobacillus folatiphilus]UQS81881.1 MarR family winged helix-turn-helix transcriptional regulator [Bombilactobacillus folatiphilus]
MKQDTARHLKIAARNLTHNFDLFAQHYQLTGAQMSFIDYLNDHCDTEVLQRDLEQEFNIQRSTATLILQRMEKKSLVKRQPAKQDARQRAVSLTDQSQAIVTVVQNYMQQQQQKLEYNFSTAEIAIFEKILRYYQQQEN